MSLSASYIDGIKSTCQLTLDTGCAGAEVSVQVSHGHSVVTSVDQTGLWSVNLMLAQGGPYNITFSQKSHGHNDTQVTLTNVLAGDVWLCSGSDDMELPVSSLVNGTEETEAALNLTQVSQAAI